MTARLPAECTGKGQQAVAKSPCTVYLISQSIRAIQPTQWQSHFVLINFISCFFFLCFSLKENMEVQQDVKEMRK